MSTFARLRRSAALLCLAIPTLHAAAQQTRRVPQDFPTIQTAINASATGDTVLVSPGTYFENLTIDTKQITLQSTAGAATTILDGQHLNPVLMLTGLNGLLTTIDGFTFQNGSAPPPPSNIPVLTGGGIYAINSGLTVSNSIFRSIIGPSVLASQSTLSLRSSTITTTDGTACTNSGVGSHSGVFLTGDSVITANGAPVPSTIFGNTIFGDGSFCAGVGIQLQSITATTLIQNNILRNNLSAFFADYAAFNLVQNLIYDNGLGAVGIDGPLNTPSTGPPTMFLTSNTLVNNHTNLQDLLNGPYVTEINILNSAAQVALRDNIVIGTTQYAVLFCQNDNPRPTTNDTPLVLDHNDLFNTSGGLVLSGNCFPNLAAPLAANGNLSADPRFSSSTDLHPQSGSPVLDAGINLVNEPLSDIDGNPRLADATGKGYPVIDLGAYERPAAASSTTPTALSLQPAAYILSPGNLSLSVQADFFSLSQVFPFGTGSVTILLNGVATSTTAELDTNGHATLSLPLPSAGIYALSATLSPSPAYAPTTSPIVYVLVTNTGPATTLTISASPSTQVTNQPITLTVHLGSTTTSGSSTTPGPIPPGDVTLLEAGVVLSVLQPDGTGLATYTIPHPTLGSHTYTVSYAGTPTYNSALASTSVGITAPVSTTLSAHPDNNPVAQGQAVACIATVVAASGPAPTGTVTFTDGATSVGSVPLTSPGEQGIATLNLGPLSIGLHTITVTFQPDPDFAPSTGTCTITVGGTATATTLTSSSNPAATTDLVSYTITVTNTGTAAAPSAPSGSVTLSEGNTLLASAPLVPGASGSSLATLPATLSTPGLHLLTATYTPATAATFTSSATLSETITAPPPITTLLSAAPNPATIGQPVTLSATATSTAALPSPATITFTDGATVLGTAPLSPAGTATLSVSTLSLGSHPLSALLRAADSPAIRSSSPPLSLQVNGLGATLSLAVTPSPAALATSPVTLTASVAPTSALPSGFALSGTVTFLDGNLALGTAPLSADGSATFTTSTLAGGSHRLSASFSGNSFLAAASSAPVAEQIGLNLTSTSLTAAPAVSTAFTPVVLSASVTSPSSTTRINTLVCPPACTPITVTFFADSSAGRTSLGSVPVDANGNASLTVAPAAGTYSLFATFSGSTLFASSSSSASTLTVAPAPTALTLSANPNPVYQHGSVTLTAALTAPGIPASALSGTITFLEGSTTLGSATLAAAQRFAYSPGSVGPHTITALFSGAASLSPSSSTTIVTVLPSDFVLSLKTPSLTIATTHHAPVTLSINTTGSLADLIDLSCSNLPQFASCTFSPATHDLTTTSASTGTLMLDTDALLNYARLTAPPAAPGATASPSGALTTLLALCVPTTLIAAFTRLRRRRRSPRPQRVTLPHLLAMLLASVAAITLSGCSGLYPPHVAPGTYAVTVTGHARTTGVEHSATLTLVVTP